MCRCRCMIWQIQSRATQRDPTMTGLEREQRDAIAKPFSQLMSCAGSPSDAAASCRGWRMASGRRSAPTRASSRSRQLASIRVAVGLASVI